MPFISSLRPSTSTLSVSVGCSAATCWSCVSSTPLWWWTSLTSCWSLQEPRPTSTTERKSTLTWYEAVDPADLWMIIFPFCVFWIPLRTLCSSFLKSHRNQNTLKHPAEQRRANPVKRLFTCLVLRCGCWESTCLRHVTPAALWS